MTTYAPDPNFKHPVCRGSWVFGNNCKVCERCLDTHPHRAGTQLILQTECPRCCGNGQTYGPNSGEDIICPDCNGKGRK